MGYGTTDGLDPATPAENAALALYNAVAHTNATWDNLTMGEMLVVNNIYSVAKNLVADIADGADEGEIPPARIPTYAELAAEPNYKQIAEGLSDPQWNLLLDVSSQTARGRRWYNMSGTGYTVATINALVKRGMIRTDGADHFFVTTDFGEKVSDALG
jgi:hypothetical protein